MAFYELTLANLEKDVLAEVSDPGNDFIGQEELRRWINFGIQYFCRKSKVYKKKAEYTWAATTDEVLLATIVNDSDHIRPVIEDAEWWGSSLGRKPLLVSRKEVFRDDPHRNVESTKNYPEKLYYDPYTKKVGLDPTPSNQGTLRILYHCEHKLLTNAGDTLDSVLEPYWLDISQYAIYRAKLKDVDRFPENAAVQAWVKFIDAIAGAKDDTAEASEPQQVVQLIDDYGDMLDEF